MKKKASAAFIETNYYGSKSAVNRFSHNLIEQGSDMDGFKKHLKVTKHSDGIIQKTQDITIPLGYYGLPHCSTNFRPMITIVPVDSKIEYQITTYSKNRDDLQNSIRIRIFPDQELMHTQAYRDDLQDLNEKRRKMMEYLFLNDKPLTVNQRRSSTTSSLNY